MVMNDWTGKCPLTGGSCGNDKVILVVRTADGKTTKFLLCPDCAGDFDQLAPGYEDVKWKNFIETVFDGMHISPMFDAGELKQVIGNIKNYNELNHFIGLLAASKQRPAPKPPSKKCADCGTTLEKMLADGKAGCGRCYENLKPVMGQVVFRSQGGATKHEGKRPKDHLPKPEDTLESLTAKMEAAVKEERYEDAAKCRDAIREKTKDKSG